MTPEQYDAWYGTPRGAWIGEAEFRVLLGLLRPQPKASLLDVGCGTGWFTRRLATEGGLQVTVLDPSEPAVAFAGGHSIGGERFVIGLAERLPFADRTFDYTVCITALCFIADQRGGAAGDAACHATSRRVGPPESLKLALPEQGPWRRPRWLPRSALAHRRRSPRTATRTPGGRA
jgi:SAM-dependent methyltransferase